MADLATGYEVPGVYVRDVTGPLVTNAGLPESVVTFVGPATGYQTLTEPLVINDSGTALAKKGVWQAPGGLAPSGVFAPIVTDALGQPMVAGVDYHLSVDLSGGLDPANAPTLIKRGPAPDGTLGPDTATTNGLRNGNTVIVTYAFTDSSYFTPLVFEDFDLVEATYGRSLVKEAPALVSSTQVASPLSLAALIAFGNGATRVICLATNPAEGSSFREQLKAAYNKTQGDYRVGIIVPILADGDSTGDPSLFANYASDLKAHVENSTQDGFPRIGIIGASARYGSALGIGAPAFDVAALGVRSARVVMAYPNRLNFYNPNLNRITEIDGYYLAAAYSGILSSNPVQQGLTREVVGGFAGFPAGVTKYQTKQFKDRLSASGVAVTEIDRQGRMLIRHGLSTDTKNVLTREVSITRGRDLLFDSLQLGLDAAGLIGTPIDDEMTTRVKGAVTGILEGLVTSGAVVAYDDVAVRQQSLADGGDPSTIEVRFAYRPAIPLNYIVVSFSLNLQTGQTTLTDIAA